ncbi:MAG TPA: mechanosensitive ion channel domain-containing protein [Nitrospiraceae bacterium]|nr:mechanosensitive ion channel domain-containing protein [Nitrospiraceae bacterium]
MLARRIVTTAVLLVLGLSSLWIAPVCLADNGPLNAAPGASAPHPLVDQAELQAKRQQAEAQLARIDRPNALHNGAPPHTPESELVERRALLQQLVQLYERHLDEAAKLEHAQQRLEEAERAQTDWQGFPDPPPYSVLKVDELRDAARSMALTAQGIRTKSTMTEGLAERSTRALKRAQEETRQAAEKTEGIKDPAQLERLIWLRDLSQLRERVHAAQVGMLGTATAVLQKELAEAERRTALFERQRDTAAQHSEFPEQDHQKITKRLESDRQELLSELDRAGADQTALRRALAAAERDLEAARQAPNKPGASPRGQPNRLSRLTEIADLKRLQYDTVGLRIDLLRQLVDVVQQERQIWDSRFTAGNGTMSIEQQREVSARFAATTKLLEGWRAYAYQQFATLAGQINDTEARLAEQPTSPSPMLRERLEALRQREDLYWRMLQRIETVLQLVANWKEELTLRGESRPLADRLRDWWAVSAATIQQAWNFELFYAEDTIEVDNKTVTGRRSVTVGKVVKALAILLIGYWIAALLGRFAERQAISRFQVDPNVANIIRQWAVAFLFTLLVIVTLMSVKIPITAFAFLGGALAIGVGFGTQNLLKNVISGLLLLIERPLRVGDVIEVDGIRGMVTTIGLRSSTICNQNAVETLIPNSTLLERNLTNWTYSSYQKRYALRVAVASGTDANKIRDLLTQLAGRHQLVAKAPAPQVLLEEFSDSALVFTLYYWIEIGPTLDPSTVASDLRFMIDKSFTESGIARK